MRGVGFERYRAETRHLVKADRYGEKDRRREGKDFMGDAELTVGQLAERSGTTISALHFYERQELITSRRTAGNQRRYHRDTLRRVALILIAQRVGIPLSQIRAALDTLPDTRVPNRRDWKRLSQRWQDDLSERIRLLTHLRDSFTECIGCGCLSITRCAMANPHDRLGRRGPGPQRLMPMAPPADSEIDV